MIVLLHELLARSWRFIDVRLNRRNIQTFCFLVLAFSIALLMLSFATQVKNRTVFGPTLGADFAAFYTAGIILNEHPREHLYDLALQERLYHRLFPTLSPNASLPYFNPPFFALIFRPLALLRFSWAYCIWLIISLGLYLAGFALIWGTLEALPKDAWQPALLLTLSFIPFLLECWIGGQMSVFGFFLIALAFRYERVGRPVVSGLALALCSYKPSLLLLMLPMLLITRSFSTLYGFAIGSFGLAFISWLVVGWKSCLDYINFLAGHTRSRTVGNEWIYRTWKFVDMNSFFQPLSGAHSYVRWAMLLAVGSVAIPIIIKAWWRTNNHRGEARNLVWAATLTWTLVINIYVPIYDTVIIVISVLLTTNALCQHTNNIRLALTPNFKFLMLMVYLVPWVTQTIALATGFQLYTLVLASLGVYQLGMIKARRDESLSV